MANEVKNEYVIKANEWKKLVESGELTQDEFEELVNDLLDIDTISSKLNNEKAKQTALEIANHVRTVVGLL